VQRSGRRREGGKEGRRRSGGETEKSVLLQPLAREAGIV
jgi:hypothetical protein